MPPLLPRRPLQGERRGQGGRLEQAARTIRFRCKRCGGKDTEVKTQFIDQDHPPKGYIWVLQKARS
ncbi:MAG: hypothetical protein E5X24_28370 [Mesorhizobium sp.]|nr:MAG: hypothetical protein E5X24_28370 [Mesorhizobium sp.]